MARMQKALEGLRHAGEDAAADERGSRKKLTERIRIFEAKLRSHFTNRVGALELDPKHALIFMRWGEEKAHLYIMDRDTKQIHRATSSGVDTKVLLSQVAGDLLYLLDEEGKFTFLENEE
jgi:hypothetical protein